MKKFKKFLQKINIDKGIPALIQQGGHSEPQKIDIERGIPVIIQQGGHSKAKSKRKEVKENIFHAKGVYDYATKWTNFRTADDPWGRDYNPTGTGAQVGMKRAVFRNMKSAEYSRDEVSDHYQPKLNQVNGARNLEELHGDLVKHYRLDPYDDAQSIHRKHIERYTSGSSDLNNELYQSHIQGKPAPRIIDAHNNGSMMHPDEDPYHRHDVHGLDRALHHFSLPSDLHVASGVKWDPGKLMNEHGTNKLFLPAYTSTSTRMQTATGFAGTFSRDDGPSQVPKAWNDEVTRHVILMHIKKGHPGAYVDHMSSFSGEKEFLLPRRSTIHLNPNPDVHTFANGHEWKIWHAHHVETESLKDMGVDEGTKSVHQVKQPGKWSAEDGPVSAPSAPFGKKIPTSTKENPNESVFTLTHTMNKKGAMRIIHNEKTHIISDHNKNMIANLKDGESHEFKNALSPSLVGGPQGSNQFDTHHFPADEDDIITHHKASRLGDKVLLASKTPHEEHYPGTISVVHHDHFKQEHDYKSLKIHSGVEEISHKGPAPADSNHDATLTHKTFGNKMIIAKGNQTPVFVSSEDKLAISKLNPGQTHSLDTHMAYKSSALASSNGRETIHLIPNGDKLGDKSVVKIHPSHFEVDHKNLKGFNQHVTGKYINKPAHLSVKMKQSHEGDTF